MSKFINYHYSPKIGGYVTLTGLSRDQKLWWSFVKSAIKNKHYHLAFEYFLTWFSLI